MRDVTPVFEHYRECARHLWNAGFLFAAGADDRWQEQERYDEIIALLFDALVSSRLGHPQMQPVRDDDGRPEPLSAFQVAPVGTPAEILVNRDAQGSGYWDDPVRTVIRDEAVLHFVRFFDFDVLGQRDFEFYRVHIADWKTQPHLVGRDALVRVRETRVLCDRTDT